MNWFIIARVLHVLAVVIWIGGVAMVTMVVIPAVRKFSKKEEQIDTFEQIEGRFSLIAKITTTLSVLTGLYMLWELNAWDRYLMIKYWWIHLMTIVWLLFTVVLFILEPLLLGKVFRKYAEENPARTFGFIQRVHWLLLTLSLVAIAGAVAGSHGWI